MCFDLGTVCPRYITPTLVYINYYCLSALSTLKSLTGLTESSDDGLKVSYIVCVCQLACCQCQSNIDIPCQSEAVNPYDAEKTACQISRWFRFIFLCWKTGKKSGPGKARAGSASKTYLCSLK